MTKNTFKCSWCSCLLMSMSFSLLAVPQHYIDLHKRVTNCDYHSVEPSAIYCPNRALPSQRHKLTALETRDPTKSGGKTGQTETNQILDSKVNAYHDIQPIDFEDLVHLLVSMSLRLTLQRGLRSESETANCPIHIRVQMRRSLE